MFVTVGSAVDQHIRAFNRRLATFEYDKARFTAASKPTERRVGVKQPMHVRRPNYYLLRDCPITGQGSSLMLYACPHCRHIAVVSAELGYSAFPDPFHVTADDETNVDDACSGCGEVLIRDFVTVEVEELNALGLKHGIDWE